MKSFFIVITLLCCSVFSGGQNNTNFLKNTINKNLARLYNYAETLYTDNAFNPDSLSNVIAQELILYVKETGLDNFDAAFFDNLELAYKNKRAPFWVLSFGYYSGSTTGFVPTSIIIKQDSNGYEYTYYNMNSYKATFYDFYQLNNNIYLCLATIPGSTPCSNNGIYVFDFDSIAQPVPVFNDHSYLTICNSQISFDEQTKTLSIEVNNTPYYHEGQDYNAYFEKLGFNFFNIFPSQISDNDFMGTLTTWFDGRKFVKPSNQSI